MQRRVTHFTDWYGEEEEDYPEVALAAADKPAATLEETTASRPVDPMGQQAGGSGAAPSVSGHVSAAPEWRPRPKESDNIFLPQYPTASSLRSWKTEVYARAQAASARSDHNTTVWLKQAEDETITPEDLGKVPRAGRTITSSIICNLQT